MQETRVWFLHLEDPLEEEMATYSNILAWRIPWTEKPGRLQSMGLQRVENDLETKQEQQQSSWSLMEWCVFSSVLSLFLSLKPLVWQTWPCLRTGPRSFSQLEMLWMSLRSIMRLTGPKSSSLKLQVRIVMGKSKMIPTVQCSIVSSSFMVFFFFFNPHSL